MHEKFRPSLKEGLGELYNLYVYIDGQFLKGDDARLSVFDHGLLYGDGIFEGIRAYDGLVFKLDEHVKRLYDSAQAISLEIQLTREEMKNAILETIRTNALRNAHIRAIVTRGFGKPGVDPRRSVRPTVIIMVYPFPPLLGERGLKLITASVRRPSPDVLDSKIKSLNYLNNVLAKIQAYFAGADDAIMLDSNGFVAELSGENLFIVKEGEFFTPSATNSLEGITKETVVFLARESGYKVAEKNITLQELYTSDEALATGTAAGIVPIFEIDGRRIGNGTIGVASKKIIDAYHKLVRDKASPYNTLIFPEK